MFKRSASSSIFAISSGEGPAGTGGATCADETPRDGFGFPSALEFAPAFTDVPGAFTFTFPSGVAVTETPGGWTNTFHWPSTFTEPDGVVTDKGASELVSG